MRTLTLALGAAIVLGPTAAWAGPKPAKTTKTNKNVKVVARVTPVTAVTATAVTAVAPAPKLDIEKWPAYAGASLVQQVHLNGDQIQGFAKDVPDKAKPALAKLGGVSVLGYKLPAGAASKPVIDFYEPRALAGGYKLMVKDLADEKEASAVYIHPGGGILVLSIEDDEKGRMLEIVSVQGDLAGLAALGEIEDKLKAAPPAKGPAKPEPPKDPND